MADSPIISAAPAVDILFDFVEAPDDTTNLGGLCLRFDWRAMLNGGYIVKCRIHDPYYSNLRAVIANGWYNTKLTGRLRFRLRWPNVNNDTGWQVAYIVSGHFSGEDADSGYIEFVAIDPPSWHLNCGDASGEAFRGSISDVIKQCVSYYAMPVALTITETTDSNNGLWYMMRQDPKTFILSLLDWSCSLTPKKTQWFIGMDGLNLQIKEQAAIQSNNIGFYRGPRRQVTLEPHIENWEMLSNNVMTLLNNKLVTQGVSAITGEYLDRITDEDEVNLFVKDDTTPSKLKAAVGMGRAFEKPPDGGPPRVGWTSIAGVPEVYSAGELGIPYGDYIDGKARALWLGTSNRIQRVRFKAHGHGVYRNSLGLGVDTITVQWMDVDDKIFFLSGNWIVYGFHHKFVPGFWTTDIYCARLAHDATAKAVPSGP